MKITPLFCSFLLLPLILFAGTEQKVPSKIKSVTVFLSGAQVNREAEVILSAGVNEIVFEGLSPYIDPNSIQVKGSKQFTILSVNHRTNYLDKLEKSTEAKKVEEKLKAEKLNLELKNSEQFIYEEEKAMILTNKSARDEKEGLFVEDLDALATFYRERLKDIQFKLLEVKQDQKTISKEISRLERQLRELNGQKKVNTGEVIVSISSNSRVKSNIAISFFVYNAGWIPNYDVRSQDVNSPVKLTYKGKVYQNSGNDWNNVKMVLSTGNPKQNNTKPTVRAHVLEYYENDRIKMNLVGAIGNKERSNSTGWAYNGDYKLEEGAVASDSSLITGSQSLFGIKNTTSADYTTVGASNVNAEFEINLPYSIPSDGKQYDVEIKKHNITASYQYYAAPKFDKDAFLIAAVTNWDQLSLLSGEANIYYQGTFVGRSYINTQVTEDTLDVSLGRDKGIVVQRKKIKDFSKTAVIGSSKKVTLGIEISLRNNKSVPVTIDLEDQIPISKDKEIVVEAIDLANASHNKSTGKLSWKVELAPGASASYRIQYSVKYPKNKTIPNF